MTPDLLALAQQDAVLVRHSSFSLAVEKAQEKLKKFQLPDARFYVSQLLQALLSSGARTVRVEIEGARVAVFFDGPGYTESELQNLADAVFESSRNRERDRLRELALSLLSVQALQPRNVSLSSNGHRWVRQGKGQRVEDAPPNEQVFRVEHSSSSKAREEETLRQVVLSCDANITVNEHALATPEGKRRTSCPWPNFAFSGADYRGAFGIAYGDLPASTLTLTRSGVVFSRRTEARIRPSLMVEIEHDTLRKNASQSDVVEDEAYSAMLAALQRAQLGLALQLAKARVPSYQTVQVNAYLREIALEHLNRELLEIPPERLGPLDRELSEARLFPGADGLRYSARQLAAVERERGALLYAETQKFGFSCFPGSVLNLSPAQAHALTQLFPTLQPLGLLSSEAAERAATLALRRREGELPPLVLRQLVPEFGVEILLPQRPEPGAVIAFRLDAAGKVLERRTVRQSELGYALLLTEGNFQSLTLPGDFERRYVEPLYTRAQELLDRRQRDIALPLALATGERPLLRCVVLWLRHARRGLHPLRELAIFSTMQRQAVSLADMEAWLQHFPCVVVAYGTALGESDHALWVFPELLDLLSETLGADKVCLAHLAEPQHAGRSQQYGLPQASRLGVRVEATEDADQELAALRQEMEAARQGGEPLGVAEEEPLDAARVLSQLRLEPVRSAPSREAGPPPPDFAIRCARVSEHVEANRLVRFELPGVQGQLLPSPSAASESPLKPGLLALQRGSGEPLYLPLPPLGICGWLQLPDDWNPQHPPGDWTPRLSPNSSAGSDREVPFPTLEFALPHPTLDQDLVWAIRRFFKLVALDLAGQPLTARAHGQWRKHVLQFMVWDEGWACLDRGSWFFRLPLFRNLLGGWVDAPSLARPDGPVFWAPLKPGLAPEPSHTVLLTPPVTPDHLRRWTGSEVEQAVLTVPSEPRELLLADIKEKLVETCQRADVPLEAAWVEGVTFATPGSWARWPWRSLLKHRPESGATELNAADRLFGPAALDAPPVRVPLLACAVYTALNRALLEVTDQDELAYLEAMLSQLP